MVTYDHVFITCHLNLQNLLGVEQKALMDRMKIIKKRLSMSLHSVRHVDDRLSELPEHSGLDEAHESRDGGETHTHTHTHSKQC